MAVIELVKEQGITDDDLRIRQEIVEEMSKVVTTCLPGTNTFYIYFLNYAILLLAPIELRVNFLMFSVLFFPPS